MKASQGFTPIELTNRRRDPGGGRSDRLPGRFAASQGLGDPLAASSCRTSITAAVQKSKVVDLGIGLTGARNMSPIKVVISGVSDVKQSRADRRRRRTHAHCDDLGSPVARLQTPECHRMLSCGETGDGTTIVTKSLPCCAAADCLPIALVPIVKSPSKRGFRLGGSFRPIDAASRPCDLPRCGRLPDVGKRLRDEQP